MRLGLSPDELLDAVRGASALVIRSATQVTADVLAAGADLVVVGRAGIGLDNVDVAAATRAASWWSTRRSRVLHAEHTIALLLHPSNVTLTRPRQRGVMVVNAPQSNVLSAAEHTIALLLAQARNIPQADADLKAGQWNRVAVGGRRAARQDARHRRPRPRRRARRAARARVRHAPRRLRPVRERRPRPPARRASSCRRSRSSSRSADFLTIHLPKTPETIGLIDADLLAHAKPGAADRQHRRAAASSTRPRSPTRSRDGRIAGAALDVFADGAHHRVAAVRARQRRRHAAPRRVDGRGAGQGRADDRRAGRARAARRVRAVRGQRRRDARRRETVQPFLPLAERLGRLFTALAGGVVDTLEISYEGEIADYDCRVLTLVGPEGRARPGRRRAGVVRERAAARRGARARRARDDVVVGAATT